MYPFIENALRELKQERDIINFATDTLEKYARGTPMSEQVDSLAIEPEKPKKKRRGRPPLSDAQKKAQSERLKAYWAAKKAGK